MEKTQVVLVRKNVNKLSNDELALFLSQMKTLFIMSPKESASNQEWWWNLPIEYQQYLDEKGRPNWRPRNVRYVPQNRYDMLISSHATCCEHRAVFFFYWHRVHTKLIEKSIRRADQLLLDPSFPNNLYKMPWDQNSKILKMLQNEENSQLLKSFSEAYREIRTKMKDYEPALHYMNYFEVANDRGQPNFIKYPPGFTAQEPFTLGQQSIDKIIDNVYQQKFWEFNIHKRWFDHVDLKGLNPYSEDRRWFRNFVNPRYPQDWPKQQNWPIRNKNYSSVMGMVGNATRKDQAQTFMSKKVVNITPVPNQYLNYFAGGQGYQYAQSGSSANYNLWLSRQQFLYIRYARSLRCVPQKFFSVFTNHGGGQQQFCIQQTHDIIHDMQGFALSDASYSIMCPMFCLYHSFFDYMGELKIRMIQGNPEDQRKAYQASQYGLAQYDTLKNTQYTQEARFNRWADDFKRTNKFQPSFSDFPIFLWMNFKQNQAPQLLYDAQKYGYFDLILDKSTKKLRNSLNPSNFSNTDFLHNLPYCYDILGPEDFGEKAIPSYLKQVYDSSSVINTYKPLPKLSFALKHRSTLPTTQFIYTIHSDYNKITSPTNQTKPFLTRLFVFFSKGEDAVDCPKCPNIIVQEQTIGYLDYIASRFIKLKYPLVLSSRENSAIQDELQQTQKDLDRRQVKNSLTVDYLNEPSISAKSNFRFESYDPELEGKLLEGRANLEIDLKNTSAHKVQVNIQINEKPNYFSQQIVSQPQGPYQLKTLHSQRLISIKSSEERKGNILSIEGNIKFTENGKQHKYTFKYVFNFYANHSNIVVDIGHIIHVVHTMRSMRTRSTLIGSMGTQPKFFFDEVKTAELLKQMVARGKPEREIEYILNRIIKCRNMVKTEWYEEKSQELKQIKRLFKDGNIPTVEKLTQSLRHFEKGVEVWHIQQIVQSHIQTKVQEKPIEVVELTEVPLGTVEQVPQKMVQLQVDVPIPIVDIHGPQSFWSKSSEDAIKETVLETVRAGSKH